MFHRLPLLVAIAVLALTVSPWVRPAADLETFDAPNVLRKPTDGCGAQACVASVRVAVKSAQADLEAGAPITGDARSAVQASSVALVR